MPAKLGVLIIHGIGPHDKNFADPMKKKLKRRISNHDGICWESVRWAEVLLKKEYKLLNKLFPEEKRPHWLKEMLSLLYPVLFQKKDLPHWLKEKRSLRFVWRELVMNGIGDVAAYRSIPNTSDHTKKTNEIYNEIHDIVHESIVKLSKELGNADKPVIVIAHSLGSVIISDYIWDRQNNKNAALYGATPFERMETLAGFITFGSPIPLFTVGYDPVDSITFPPDTLQDNLKDKAKWLNFYDAHDVFGWPLKHLNACVSEDKPINVGSIFTRWNLLCHSKYWTDNNFTKPVAKYISEILKLCP
jgi:hypothetical protein